MNCKTFIILSMTGVLFLSCKKQDASQYLPQQNQTPEHYPTTVMQETNVILENIYPATIRGQEDIEIRPRIDGFIEQINIDEGSVVRKGQTLFRINSPQSIQAVETARATVTTAQSNLNTAQLNVDRMRPLAEKNIISNVQLETYENQYSAAVASLRQAQASLTQSEATLSWTNVTSPVDGIVGSIPYRQGSLVSSSNVLTTIANTSNVYAYFSLNEKELLELLESYPGNTQAEKIKNMPMVTLTLADGTVYPEKGRIETIAGVVNTSTGSTNFRAEFANPQGLLRSGSSGQISIPHTLKNVFEIPQKATFNLQDKILVYKVQGDSVVQTVITVEATPDGQRYAVTGGLNSGERIVTDGIATLSNGKKILVD
ncbi:MAG: efflux RND transporter periplasmic adaptor subunit [Candidatus Azobacteroides sp.]|nr:efflux RND transporter periplasmic adaptor subunit [Candidatus Azobacteroides sp.]